MKAGELCNREVVVIRKGQTVLEAAQLMRTHHVGSLIIVEEENELYTPKGIVTDRDLTIEVMAEGLDPKEILVEDIVQLSVITAYETDDIDQAIHKMKEKGIRRLPVVDQFGHLTGILSLDDLLEFLSEELGLLARVFTRERDKEEEKTLRY